uniref:Uncharacterized protein n=1 Tax=Anopheles epiroticus TaxID=199890 RepID=A0A182P166_9DIPT
MHQPIITIISAAAFGGSSSPLAAGMVSTIKSPVIKCGKCKISTKRLNLNKFCKRDYARTDDDGMTVVTFP